METNVEKMIIIPLDKKGNPREKEKYEVLVNPEKYEFSHVIKLKEQEAQGQSGAEMTYEKTEPIELKFTFLFDATGSLGIDDRRKNDKEGVKPEIDEFKKVVFDYNGENHEPNKVCLNWGTLNFKGRLTSLKIAYELFNAKGVPIRAKVDTTFKSNVEEEYRKAKENKSSPDLTHKRTVKEGDTLPLMTERIYGDARHYLEVAKYNNLRHFRQLQAGTQLFFPPLEK